MKEKKPCPGTAGFACETCAGCEELDERKIPEIQSVVSDFMAMKKQESPKEYDLSDPIEFKPKMVFQVNFDDGEKWIVISPPEVTLEDTIETLIGRYPKRAFRVGQVEAGIFKLAKIYVPDGEAVFRSDSRWVTSDRCVEF